MQKWCRLILIIGCWWLVGGWAFAQAQEIPQVSAEEFFLSAVEEYYQGRYSASRARLQALEAYYPASELAPEALFLTAKTLQAEGFYTWAQEKLHTFLALYPRHPQIPEVLKTLRTLEEREPPIDRPGFSQPPAVRAAQISILWENSWEEVRQTFRALRRQGINTVILRVFHNKGDRPHALAVTNSVSSGVYFDSKTAPVVEDILGPAVKIAHQEGLLLWAWMNTRRADWWPDWELREWSYSPKSQHMSYSRDLSPFAPETLSRMRALYRELAVYDIDGILLQDDLNFRQWEGFSPAALKIFYQDQGHPLAFYSLIQEKPGNHPAAGSLFWEWCRWRRQKLLQYMEELINEAKGVRPSLTFALNLPYETLTHPAGALSWFSLDFYEARHYPIDYFALMFYHRQMAKELKTSPEAIKKILRQAGKDMIAALPSPRQALFKVQVLDWDTEEVLPAQEVKEVLEALVQRSGASWAVTPYRREVEVEGIISSNEK